jgi:hypothetical protein
MPLVLLSQQNITLFFIFLPPFAGSCCGQEFMPAFFELLTMQNVSGYLRVFQISLTVFSGRFCFTDIILIASVSVLPDKMSLRIKKMISNIKDTGVKGTDSVG